MNRTRQFFNPIVIKDRQAIVGLADARDLILRIAERRQVREHWQEASELLMRASKGPATVIDFLIVAGKIRIALEVEGLIHSPGSRL